MRHLIILAGLLFLTLHCADPDTGSELSDVGNPVDALNALPDVPDMFQPDTLAAVLPGDTSNDVNVDTCSDDDQDCDGSHDGNDNCPAVANVGQVDTDLDGKGDACDDDDDGDGVPDEADRFPLDPSEWSDVDDDGVGDNADTETCDGIDNDGDGVADNGLTLQAYYPDGDGDGFGAYPSGSCSDLPAGGETTNGVYQV